jgi:D-3-phosphoglycerate dehydrogenase
MHVLFIDTVHPILSERLTANGYQCVDGSGFSEEQIIESLPVYNGIVIRSRFKLDSDFLKHARNLQFVARSGAGMENIDENYCSENNIVLFNAPEGNRNAVGEHALGMLLALFNNLLQADAEIRNGKWDREGNRGIEVAGKTIGIIGYGNNGSCLAKLLKGFDVRVLAHDKYKSGFQKENVEEASLQQLFEEADIVSFHIPQNEETLFFANDSFFSSFKKPIYLINLSRGKIVETAALVKALKSGKVLGACLDVLEYEKSSFENFFEQNISIDFQYILSAKNVLLSPHVGGWTHESYFKLSDVLADKILSFFNAK